MLAVLGNAWFKTFFLGMQYCSSVTAFFNPEYSKHICIAGTVILGLIVIYVLRSTIIQTVIEIGPLTNKHLITLFALTAFLLGEFLGVKELLEAVRIADM